MEKKKRHPQCIQIVMELKLLEAAKEIVGSYNAFSNQMTFKKFIQPTSSAGHIGGDYAI